MNGTSRLVAIDLNTNEWRQLAGADTLSLISNDAMARLDDSSLLVIGSGTASLLSVHKLDLQRPELSKVIRQSTDEKFPRFLFSRPEPIRVRSKGSPCRDIHGFLWMPRNPDFTAPQGALPPLIIDSHGGPTGHTGCGLSLRVQYFTSRGYALFALNYAGSTGYGRDYRNSLFGHWGIMDADDAAECAEHLVATGRVKSGAIGITGLSAGGYNTLQVLVRHSSTFAGGLCVSGISELEKFDRKTHKLEFHYTQALVLPKGGADEDARAKIYRQRSALYHTDKIQSPLVLLHGLADTVVPVEQATLMADRLREERGRVEIVLVEDEGHMMGQPSSMKLWLEIEERLWMRTLFK